MPLSAAERQKNYRKKLKETNPEKFELHKKQNNERTQRNYRNRMANLTEEQKNELKIKWKEDEKKKRSPQTSTQELNVSVKANEGTISDAALLRVQRKIEHKFKNENLRLEKKITALQRAFRRFVKKIESQQEKIQKMKDDYKILMKKLKVTEKTDKFQETKEAEKTEENQEAEVIQDTTGQDYTPMKRTTDFINTTIPNIETPKKEEIKKKIFEHDILKEAIKSEYKKSSHEEKKVIRKIIHSDIAKKYRHTTKLKAVLGLKYEPRKFRESQKKSVELQRKIISFYNRDDVTRTTAGKKQYRTFKKQKKQIRYLLDNLKTLHAKYVSEHGRISFSTFKKYRPFYVLPPKISNRDTCDCIKHSNMQFMIDILKYLGLLNSDHINEVISNMVCDFNSKDCMYDDCVECSDKKIDGGDLDQDAEVQWNVWALKEYEYTKDGDRKNSKKMMKTTKQGTVKDLIELFHKQICPFKKHVYNFYYQYHQYRTCIDNLKENEALIHIDFSENYTCKYHKEVQATHFIKEQTTLHTGVLYRKNKDPMSFCTISPDNQHNPEAIWAHLHPILNYIKDTDQNVTTIHFFSDGPTTQYRQKKNFYLFSRNIYDYGFLGGTWNFFEASHGKGAADGVGGAIKRALDLKVSQGVDIPNAQTAFDVLKSTETVIRLFYVAPEIKLLEPSIAQTLTPLTGTMKIHQLITKEKLKLKYRDFSCFCKDGSGDCMCFSPQFHDFTRLLNLNQKTSQSARKRKSINKTTAERNRPKKLKRNSTDTSSSESSEEIQYADDSDTTCFMPEDSDNDFVEETHIDSSSKNTINDLELDEKTGIFQRRYGPNKKIEVLSTIVIQEPKTISDSVAIELQKKGYGIEVEGIPVKKDNVVVLSEIKYREENTACYNLSDSKIFKKKYNVNDIEKENANMPCTSQSLPKTYVDDELKFNPDNVRINDSVIVRYYQRKQWKYYVGFILEVLKKDDEFLYKVRFLKTVITPKLKFLLTRKNDIDIVPADSIVKTVSLLFVDNNEYLFEDNFDTVYFT